MPTEREARQRLGVRREAREAKRHAALDSADVASKRSAFPRPSGGDPKRRRRCALTAQSKTWRSISALNFSAFATEFESYPAIASATLRDIDFDTRTRDPPRFI